MSYWITLCNEGENVIIDHHQEGGTFAVGGTSEACLNVTYNYGGHIRDHLDKENGLRWLHGKTGAETAAKLEHAVNELGTKQSNDYWEATPGNAGYALSILAKWAVQYPNAIWRVN